MDRRTFIGSVIGMIGTLPFKAEAVEYAPNPLTDSQRSRIFGSIPDLSDAELLRYKMFSVVELPGSREQVRFFAPAIKKIERSNTGDMSVTFIADDIKMNVPCTALGMGVLLPTKQLLIARSYHSRVYMVPGDALRNTYTAYIPVLEADNIK